MLRRMATLLAVTGIALGAVSAAGADPPAGCPAGFLGPVPLNRIPEPTVGWTTNAPVYEPPLVCYRAQETGNGVLNIVIPFH